MAELQGKIALITGAARGLGAAIAEVFVREGARVLLTDVLATEGACLAERLGATARFMVHDVTSEPQWVVALDTAQAAFGRVDILVNNAGLAGHYTFEETSPALWDRLVAVMQTGPYLGMRTVIPAMRAGGGGGIVNVASTNAIRGMALSAAYTSAKHGLLGATRALALEYAEAGIRINAVCPGAMRTSMFQESMDGQEDAFAQRVPLRRFADPLEVAELVSFVASPRASYCVGAAFVADGGMTAGF